jgi:hypothetical protein
MFLIIKSLPILILWYTDRPFYAEMKHPTQGKREKLNDNGNQEVITALGAIKRLVKAM